MKRVFLAVVVIVTSVWSVAPVRANQIHPTRDSPPITTRPLVFERYPIDLSAFDSADTDADGPFDFTAPIGGFRPVDYLMGDDRGGDLPPESNHTFYGLDPATKVYAGISGVIHLIQNNPAGECDKEIYISPDSPVMPYSLSVLYDHVIPTDAILSAYGTGNPVRVTPGTQIGTVGLRSEGGCATSTVGWLEIGVGQNYPYDWNQRTGDPSDDMPTLTASYCPILFLPTGTTAPTMPQRPVVGSGLVSVTASGARPPAPLLDRLMRTPDARSGDTSPPRLVRRTPAKGQRGVKKGAKLTLTFNEPVKLLMPTRTDLRITVFRQSPRNLSAAITASSDAIAFKDNRTRVVITLPPGTLENGRMYAVKVDGNFFGDRAGNPFRGFATEGAWYFSVGPTTVQPAVGPFTSIRTTISRQLRNVMTKYNRMAVGTVGYEEYTASEINPTTGLAMCSRASFGDEIVN